MKRSFKINKVKTLLVLCSFILLSSIYFGYIKFRKKLDITEIVHKEQMEASITNVPEDYTGIWTAEELVDIMSDPDNLYENYILMDDIDMSGKDYTIIGQSQTEPFRGIFDGNYHEISNVIINSNCQMIGMFGVINGGTVRNLTIKNIDVKSAENGNMVGGLAGYILGKTNIQNVNIIGVNLRSDEGVRYQCKIGGLIGYVDDSTIKQCDVSGKLSFEGGANTVVSLGGIIGEVNINKTSLLENVTSEVDIIYNLSFGQSKIGGLIGDNNGATINKCHSIGNIISNNPDVVYWDNSEYCIGGLIGSSSCVVTESYSNVNININFGKKKFVGGLIGKNWANIEKSYSTGSIIVDDKNSTTENYIGGLIGSSSLISIKNAYTIVNIHADLGESQVWVGGFMGNAFAEITNVYVVGKMEVKSTNKYVDALIGSLRSKGGLNDIYTKVSNSYWSSYIYDEVLSNKLVPYTKSGTEQFVEKMLYQDNYSGWDFDTIWGIKENGGSLPYLLCFGEPKDEVLEENIEYTKFKGTGTENDPFVIETIEQFEKMNMFDSDSYCVLANDINLSDIENFIPIGRRVKPFEAKLNGNNYVVSNAKIESDDTHIGLFAKSTGIIKNLNVNELTITSNGSSNSSSYPLYLGGVIGYNEGLVENVQISGNINNIGNYVYSYIGQIAGANSGNIINCETKGVLNNTGTVLRLYIGQITGGNYNTIKKLHAKGTIKNTGVVTDGWIGGIAGINDSLIKECYNEGNINIENVENVKEGGISGSLDRNRWIENSYSKGEVTINAKTAFIGGIVGENEGRILNTYSVDKVQKTITGGETLETSGGICGANLSNIGTVVSSYWNISNIDQDQEGKGTYKTIKRLKKKTTFENWDFDTRWSIDEDIDMPKLTTEHELTFKDDEYWEWYVKSKREENISPTVAYKGDRCVILEDRIIFLNDNTYGTNFLYKNDKGNTEKIFKYRSTPNNCGLIFNASKENDKISGYLLYCDNVNTRKFSLYRLDNADITYFYNNTNYTIELDHFLGEPLCTSNAGTDADGMHNFEVKVSSQNVTVMHNGVLAWSLDLDPSKHSGDDFALIKKNTKDDAVFTNFQVTEINNKYTIPVVKTDENKNPLSGAKFVVKNELEQIIQEAITDENGTFYMENLGEGVYSLEEIDPPLGYKLQSRIYMFEITDDGNAVDVNTGEKISFTIVNEPLKFEIKDYIINTEIEIQGSKIQLYDESCNPSVGLDGKPIIGETGADGKIVFTGIKPGTYNYMQIEVPEGYVINNTMNKVIVAKDGTITYIEGENKNGKDGIIYNDRVMSTEEIVIKKYIKGTTTGVSGAIIGLYREDGKEITGENGEAIRATTDENGK